MTGTVPIEEKIAHAHDLAPKVGALLRRDGLLEKLNGLRATALLSKKKMDALGISKICAQCARMGDGAGCCSQKIEGWYDVPTLILNVLLGVPLPSTRKLPDSCIFLGETGCELLVRYHFCVNYLCKKIERSLEKTDLNAMRAQYGKELYASWELEKVIWRYFNMNL